MVIDGVWSAAAGTLADYTRAALILPELRERDTAGIVSELSQALQREGVIPDLLPFYHTALNQELLSDSVLETGVAVPHARMSGIKELRFAFGRTPGPVTWGGRCACAVQFVFLAAVPATEAAGSLQLLASLARLAQQEAVLAALRAAVDPPALLSVFDQIKVRPT